MNTLASELNQLYASFDKDKTLLKEVIESCPASALSRVLLVKKYSEDEDSGEDEYSKTLPVYLPDPAWYSFVVSQTAYNKENIETGHFAVQYREPEAAEKHEETLSMAPVIPVESVQPSVETEEETVPENESDDLLEAPTLESEDSLFDEDVKIVENDTRIDEPAILIEGNDPSNDEAEPVQETDEETVAYDDHNKTSDQADGKEIEQQEENPVGEMEENPIVEERETCEIPEKDVVPSNENTEETLAFEPLHTVDFFASQGIHLKEEDLEDDKLGRQLKSFTGWLKSMKRLHPGKLPEQDEVIERIIQTSAEVSNTEVDVLTEAMADVLVKQNKKEKAIEMYNKLSLMNPSKSAYFAAKIESLKTD